MASVNKVIIIGYLGRDPEVRYTPAGTAVATFSVATSRKWKDKSTGDPHEETEWHRMVAYDRLGEIVGEYLSKGKLAYFEGRLKTRQWKDKEGVTRYTTEIVVDQMTMLGGARSDSDGDAKQEKPASTGSAYADAKAGRRVEPDKTDPAKSSTGTGFDDMDDDIPF